MRESHKNLKIAIDGYSSCGKSSFAKLIASELEYLFIDSGAMYRAVTLYFLRNEIIDKGDIDFSRVDDALNTIDIDFHPGKDRHNRTYLNGEDVEEHIRSMQVSEMVSQVSRIASVREKMVALQRKMSEGKGVVMDGRDIGTVVFPNADIKVFMTADTHVRAERRYLELQEKGIEGSIREIEQNIIDRDLMDESRTESPLRKAHDAWILDNSEMSLDEQMAWFRKILKKKLK